MDMNIQRNTVVICQLQFDWTSRVDTESIGFCGNCARLEHTAQLHRAKEHTDRLFI